MKSDSNLKLCVGCGETKFLNEFHKRSGRPCGVQPRCKECRKEIDAERYKDSSYREKIKERQQTKEYKNQRKEYRLRPERIEADKKRTSSNEYKEITRRADKKRNKDPKRIEARRKWQRSEKHLSGTRRRHHKRKQDDIQYVLKRALRGRLYHAVKDNSKIGSAVDLLGCSVADFKVHIEKHFSYDMSWGNYGKWHLDHKLPLSSFDLTQESQIKTACHYTNIQPLWATDNIKKGSRV